MHIWSKHLKIDFSEYICNFKYYLNMKDRLSITDNGMFRICKRHMMIAGVWRKGFPGVEPIWQNLYRCYSLAGQLLYASFILSYFIKLYFVIGVDLEAGNWIFFFK